MTDKTDKAPDEVPDDAPGWMPTDAELLDMAKGDHERHTKLYFMRSELVQVNAEANQLAEELALLRAKFAVERDRRREAGHERDKLRRERNHYRRLVVEGRSLNDQRRRLQAKPTGGYVLNADGTRKTVGDVTREHEEKAAKKAGSKKGKE